MSEPSKSRSSLRAVAVSLGAVLLTVAITLIAVTDLPAKLGLSPQESSGPVAQQDNHDDHSGHDHGPQGHSNEHSIELSAQARTNLKLLVEPVSIGTFTEYVDVPSAVADWPGRTHVAVTSPLTGVINAIYVTRGELIESGAPLFSLRLTHQDLVNTQQTFLGLLGELDVEQREISRLASIANTGAVAGKTLINREYERDKRLAAIQAARQALLLHGLSEEQIGVIEQRRELVREVTIFAPSLHEDRSLHHDALSEPRASTVSGGEVRYVSLTQPVPDHPAHIHAEFLVTELEISRGESVETGQKLAQLSDYTQVLIEGHAFQRDAESLRKAADSNLPLQAVLDSADGPEIIDGLNIIYIGNQIGLQSRALTFYVALENRVERSEQRGDQRYISWRYKPGQRLKLRVPVASISDAIVVPKQAVAEEGPERYVFVENGDHFDRVPVSIVAQDSIHVAIANDGQVWPGQSIAINRAHQLQMALKNKSGGGIDPHAGHNH